MTRQEMPSDAAAVRRLRGRLRSRLSRLPGTVGMTVEQGSWRFQLHGSEPFPAASLIKVPILLTVLESARQGEIDLDAEMIPPDAAVGGGGLVEFFSSRSRLTLSDLLLCMIAVSDNAATNALLEIIGFDRVNGFIAGLGLGDTVLRRRMMDGEARRAGRENVTTPADMHSLLRELVRPVRIAPEVAGAALTYLQRQQLPQGLGFFLPEGVFAHKTGELEGVFHDVGVVMAGDREPVLMTYMSKGVPSVSEAQVVAGKLGRLVYDALMEGSR